MFNWDESVAGLPAEAPSGAHLTPQMGSHPAYGLAARPRRRCRALGVGFRPLPDSTPRSGEYQNPWGQSSRHRRSNVQAPTPNACSAFRRRTVSPFDPTDFDAPCAARSRPHPVGSGTPWARPGPGRGARSANDVHAMKNTTATTEWCVRQRAPAGNAIVWLRAPRARGGRHSLMTTRRARRLRLRSTRTVSHRFGPRLSPSASDLLTSVARITDQ